MKCNICKGTMMIYDTEIKQYVNCDCGMEKIPKQKIKTNKINKIKTDDNTDRYNKSRKR